MWASVFFFVCVCVRVCYLLTMACSEVDCQTLCALSGAAALHLGDLTACEMCTIQKHNETTVSDPAAYSPRGSLSSPFGVVKRMFHQRSIQWPANQWPLGG